MFEICFPATSPLSPPFFQIIKPRMVPFIYSGNGHVIGDGSTCLDLLRSDCKSRSVSFLFSSLSLSSYVVQY